MYVIAHAHTHTDTQTHRNNAHTHTHTHTPVFHSGISPGLLSSLLSEHLGAFRQPEVSTMAFNLMNMMDFCNHLFQLTANNHSKEKDESTRIKYIIHTRF